jgi:hypothetical protein
MRQELGFWRILAGILGMLVVLGYIYTLKAFWCTRDAIVDGMVKMAQAISSRLGRERHFLNRSKKETGVSLCNVVWCPKCHKLAGVALLKGRNVEMRLYPSQARMILPREMAQQASMKCSYCGNQVRTYAKVGKNGSNA